MSTPYTYGGKCCERFEDRDVGVECSSENPCPCECHKRSAAAAPTPPSAKLTHEQLVDIRHAAEFDRDHVGAEGSPVRERAVATLQLLDEHEAFAKLLERIVLAENAHVENMNTPREQATYDAVGKVIAEARYLFDLPGAELYACVDQAERVELDAIYRQLVERGVTPEQAEEWLRSHRDGGRHG
jgi:hypothetical protein